MVRPGRMKALLAAGLLAGGLGGLVPLAAAGGTPAGQRPRVEAARAQRAATGQPGFPVSVATPYGRLHMATAPHRVISLSPTATEMLYAIGAGHEVVAVDNDSNYPKHIPRTSLSGYTPNVEAIAGYHPDLVVISYNPTPPNLVTSLRLLHIPVLYLPATANLGQTYSELNELGKVTGERAGAARVVTSMRKRVARLVAEVHHRKRPLTYFVELDPTLYTATSHTFIGSILSLAGLSNIAGASVHGNDYPQLSTEAVIHANPSLILLTDGATVASVAARPGWSALAAVRDHRVIELDPDIASRWGPRIVDLLARIVRLTNTTPTAKAP